jgi:hypothetical protein
MKKKEMKWRVVRIQGARAAEICVLNARSEEAAIKAAIKEFEISDPSQQKRLAAHPYE